jgi:hypothetical protein
MKNNAILILLLTVLSCSKDKNSLSPRTGKFKCKVKLEEYYTIAPYSHTIIDSIDTLNIYQIKDSLFFQDNLSYKFNGFNLKSSISEDTFNYFNSREYGYGIFYNNDSVYLHKETLITAGIRNWSYCTCSRLK